MKSIVVFGSTGQLASELKDISNLEKRYQFHFISRNEVNFESGIEIQNYFSNLLPKDTLGIINAVAYTAVDLAETEIAKAKSINTVAPGIISEKCNQHGIKFIHISTDFVFDGQNSTPYLETDTKNPLSVYGKTKSEGEDLVLQNDKNAIILRTSWVYSKYGKNFLKTILRLSSERGKISVVDDQIGTPTWAKDLAHVSLEAITSNLSGIFHFSNEGVASWYDFAHEIVSLSNKNCKVKPIPSASYPTPAKRPSFSVLNKTKIRNSFQFQNYHWKDRIPLILSELN
ncbi:dTDP-4-dehydrorhamnose reductase [Leptospira limi]|uniref:dTDP-4-dehydrorhamnose reductase n=1 Tax=Leptospira limi TaxID=2950023 RepID=A0ABT3LYX9_9LEPT|nr:dTDP-4-dehydrorhamnose reductase [Leptospira limi]MCW7462929.1 dTDP-4-dehydrorhamnose reductase [Leptospira limi]